MEETNRIERELFILKHGQGKRAYKLKINIFYLMILCAFLLGTSINGVAASLTTIPTEVNALPLMTTWMILLIGVIIAFVAVIIAFIVLMKRTQGDNA